MTQIYKHSDEVAGADRAAEIIVPIILECIPQVNSVVDLGGGSGAWLRRFQELGVKTVRLYDVPDVAHELLIDPSSFQAVNLNEALPPVTNFDLAVCVECAEHIQPERSRDLVQWLTSVADVVVFSAAIPGQPGKGHINPKTPEEWASLFRECDFARHDILRGSIIFDSGIPYWYRQNLFVFAKTGVELAGNMTDFIPEDFSLVHNDPMQELCRPGFRSVLRTLPRIFAAAIRRRF